MDHKFEYQDWHSSGVFNSRIMDYHYKFARQPNVAEAKARLELLKEDIRKQMTEQGLFICMGFKYKGSTYEGVKITESPDDCPEFDLDFVMKGGEYLHAEKLENQETAHELKLKNDRVHNLNLLVRAKEGEDSISSEKVMRLFYGSLTKCNFTYEYNIKLRYHGPAVQLDVHHPNSNIVWFQVDLAPAFYLEGSTGGAGEKYSECYIAKSPHNFHRHNLWYRSYSVDEKKVMDGATGQRKIVLRTLKALKARSSQFRILESYFLKMCLFAIMGDHVEELQWMTHKTGQRFIDILVCIHTCLETGIMPSFLDGSLHKITFSHSAMSNLKNYIWKLINNEKKMYDFLSSCSTD